MELRIAEERDAGEIHAVMTTVHEGMENKELFVCDSSEFVREHISREGFTVAACDEQGRIVGSLIVRFPGLHEDNLGRELGLSEELLYQVAHMESAVVLPEYRGRGLQTDMLRLAEERIVKLGAAVSPYGRQIRYLMGTVSPENPASYRSCEKCGYRLLTVKEKYGGRLRGIYYRELGGEE